MNRGSSGPNDGPNPKTVRFNEAPIHESGKSRRPPPDRSRSRSFNEAPIHESGKCQRARCPGHRRRASMRPRFMNRGSLDCEDPIERAVARFNEAPIHESGK